MGSFSIWHWALVFGVVLVLFGGGKRLSSTMGDLGRGLRVFRKEISDLGAEESPASLEDKRPAVTEHINKEAVPS